MAKGSLRRFDVQAKWSVIFSAVAFVFMLGLLFMLARNFKGDMKVIQYGKESIYSPVVFGLTALAMLLAATGTAIGFNSAGQRRNELTRVSWLAFFVGALTMSLTIILFAAFFFLRFPL